MKDKNKIIIYRDWIDYFEPLTDEEAGQLIKHLFRYVNDQDPEPANRITELSFLPIKKILKRDLKKWEAIRDRNRENGAKGGRPKETQKTQSVNLETQKNPEKPVTVIDTVNVIDNSNNTNKANMSLSTESNGVNKSEMLKTFVVWWNNRLVPMGYKRIIKLNATRKRNIWTRYNESPEDFKTVSKKLANNKWLPQQTWATVDFFFKSQNFLKTLEGNYDKPFSSGVVNKKMTHDEEMEEIYKNAGLK